MKSQASYEIESPSMLITRLCLNQGNHSCVRILPLFLLRIFRELGAPLLVNFRAREMQMSYAHGFRSRRMVPRP